MPTTLTKTAGKIRIEALPIGSDKAQITLVNLEGDETLTETVRLASAEDRDQIAERFPPPLEDAVRAELEKLAEEMTGGKWDAPKALPAELPPVATFPLDLLPETLRPWLADIADRMQCPLDYLGAAVMVSLSSLVARKLAVRPKLYDDWTVIPNVWGVVIGPPGVLKTPAILEALKPIKILEDEATEEHETAVTHWKAREEVQVAAKANQKEDIRKRLKRGESAESLAQKLVAVAADNEPLRRRFLVNDATVEKLTEILRDSPGGVLVYRDELLGLLYQLQKEGQEHARTFYLEGWSGGQRYESNRIGRGDTRVSDNTLSVLGGVQPRPLRAYLTQGHAGLQDDGLMQRFQLAVWPDVPPQWRNVDRPPNYAAQQRARQVFAWLATLNNEAMRDLGAEWSSNAQERPYLHFTPDALATFTAWRETHEPRVRSGVGEHPAFIAHLSKYRSLVPSLALIIHLTEMRGGPVGIDALEAALAWAEYLESHARRVYASIIGLDATPTHALAAKLLANAIEDGFKCRELYRHGWSGLKTPDDGERAVEQLTALGWLRPVEVKAETGGPPTTIYRINPRIRSGQ